MIAERTASRSAFLQRIRAALGKNLRDGEDFDTLFPGADPLEVAERTKAVIHRSHEDRLALLDLLASAGAAINMVVKALPHAGAVAEAVEALVLASEPEWGSEKRVVAWEHPLLGIADLDRRLEKHGIPVTTPAVGRERFHRQAAQALVGMTAADFCIAETATLVMKTRSGEPRITSLLPSIHVAVLPLERLVADLTELYALLNPAAREGADPIGHSLTLVSGPSKTADIELSMVHGAHGPRALQLFVLTG